MQSLVTEEATARNSVADPEDFTSDAQGRQSQPEVPAVSCATEGLADAAGTQGQGGKNAMCRGSAQQRFWVLFYRSDVLKSASLSHSRSGGEEGGVPVPKRPCGVVLRRCGGDTRDASRPGAKARLC